MLPDAERLQEQVDEMISSAEIRAAVAEDHRDVAAERKATAEREFTKCRNLHEVFTMGLTALQQRKTAMLQAEEAPSEAVLAGIDGAIAEMEGLIRQVSTAMYRNEGSFMALSAMEETLDKKRVEATARARGLVVQGQRAVGVAASRTGAPATGAAQEGAQSVLSSLQNIQGPGSAKEPMGSP